MSFFHLTTIAVAASFVLSDPFPLFAQTSQDPYGEEGETETSDTAEREAGNGHEPIARPRSSSTPVTTETMVASLNAATSYCTLISNAYAIDCMSERLGELAKQLKGQDGFEEIQAVLESTSKDLNDIARRNRSAALPPATFSTQGQVPIKTSRNLIPVDDVNLDVAVSQALAVIDQAETLLLRSAEQSADRAIQFQQIASAIGSNKVLLRSL